MNPLRTMPTRRLLGVCGAVVALGAGGVAVAQSRGGGPTPPPAPLANAIHDALAAQHPTALSARIRFTDHLIDSAAVPGGSALLTGASGRLWLGDGKARLELQSDAGDVQIGVDGQNVTVYDASSNTVYKATLPADQQSQTEPQNAHQGPPTVAQIQQALGKLAGEASLTGAQPTDVAGQPAYQVRITPSHDAGLLAAGELAWDAVRGVPLKVAIYAAGNADPVLALKATDISYGPVSASDLTVSTPAGAQVVNVTLPGGNGAGEQGHAGMDVHGATAVQAKLSFPLVAPATLVGLPLKDVTLVSGKDQTALVTYGKGLGGIAVLESAAKGKDKGGMLSQLPKVSINGASGSELPTALGTVIRVQRTGVTYTLAGSLPPAAAEAAARELLK